MAKPADSSDLAVKQKHDEPKKVEKDPEVKETIEDDKFTQKLQQEREKRRQSRELNGKNKTETTQKLEEAIEQLENSNADTQRTDQLKEIDRNLKYSTKPTLSEFLKKEKERNSRNKSAGGSGVGNERTRTRSLSASGRMDPSNAKYANVKPKISTRLPPSQSARMSSTDGSMIHTSTDATSQSKQKRDLMNDSASLRENVYNEWYQNKMKVARENLKEAKLRQKDDEEKKAQEMIDKLEKSKLVFKLWQTEKSREMSKRKQVETKSNKTEEEMVREKEQKRREGEKAIQEWLATRMDKMREQKEKDKEAKRKEERAKRNKKLKQQNRASLDPKDPNSQKPPPAPLSHDEWEKKKKQEIAERKKTESEKQREKERKLKDEQAKKDQAQEAYQKWLEKKENEHDLRSSKALSQSMSSLPPFYPNSRTIPFGR